MKKYFVFLVLLNLGCVTEKFEDQSIIKKIGFESVYDDIKWELYKSALYCEGHINYDIKHKLPADTIDNLMEYDLKLDTILPKEGQITLLHTFKNKERPERRIYPMGGAGSGNRFFYSLTFSLKDKSLIAYSSGSAVFKAHGLKLTELSELSDTEFTKELVKRKKLHPWLEKEVKRRGYPKEEPPFDASVGAFFVKDSMLFEMSAGKEKNFIKKVKAVSVEHNWVHKVVAGVDFSIQDGKLTKHENNQEYQIFGGQLARSAGIQQDKKLILQDVEVEVNCQSSLEGSKFNELYWVDKIIVPKYGLNFLISTRLLVTYKNDALTSMHIIWIMNT